MVETSRRRPHDVFLHHRRPSAARDRYLRHPQSARAGVPRPLWGGLVGRTGRHGRLSPRARPHPPAAAPHHQARPDLLRDVQWLGSAPQLDGESSAASLPRRNGRGHLQPVDRRLLVGPPAVDLPRPQESAPSLVSPPPHTPIPPTGPHPHPPYYHPAPPPVAPP